MRADGPGLVIIKPPSPEGLTSITCISSKVTDVTLTPLSFWSRQFFTLRIKKTAAPPMPLSEQREMSQAALSVVPLEPGIPALKKKSFKLSR